MKHIVLAVLAVLLLGTPAQSRAFLLIGPGTTPSTADPTIGILPSDRDAWGNWKMAGMQSVGGIPNRTTVCATLEPLGGGQDDTSQIQTAIGNCAAGDVLMLGDSSHCSTASPCVFTIGLSNYVWLNKGISLRGVGGGATYVNRPTEYPYGSGLTMPNCPAGSSSALNYGCGQGNGTQVVIRVSPFANNSGNTWTACALTADTTHGAMSLSVTSGCAGNFHAGDIVLLDEAVDEQWMPDPMSNSGGTTTVCANDDYSDVFQVYNSPSGIVGGSDANSCPLTSQSAVYGAYTLNPDRQRNELKRIQSVSGTTITFDSPIMLPYRVSHSADLWYFGTQPLAQAGVENMSIRYGQDAVQFYFCQYCWVKGTNVSISAVNPIAVWASFRVDVDQNYVHECSWPEPGEVCYNYDAKYDSSEILFEDNISTLANKVFASNGAGGGNVYAYNYVNSGYIEGQPGWQEMGLNASHLTGTHHVLFEGNGGFNMDSDDTHGGSSYITYFRNWSTATRTAFQGMTQGNGATTLIFQTQDDTLYNCGQTSYSGSPQRAAGPAAHSYWFSYIGNVLGTPGCTTAANSYQLNNKYGGPYNSDGIFFIGWYNNGQGQVNNDPITSTIYPNTPPTITCATGVSPGCAVSAASCTTYGNNCATILYNNFDYVRAADCDGNSGTCTTPTHAIPASFYLSLAPPYFNGFSWPWVDPTNAPSTTAGYDALPAKNRYDTAIQVGGGASGSGCAMAVFQNNSDCEPFGAGTPPTPTITGVTVGGATALTYISGIASGTSLGAVAVAEINGTFGGTVALGGTDAADFCFSSGCGTSPSLPVTLNTNGSTPACTTAATYNILITPTQSGVTNSGTAYALTVACDPGNDYALASSHLTLSNNNRTITLPSADGNDHRAITSSSYSTGTLYTEWTCNQVGSNDGFGIANKTPSLDDWLGHDNNSAGFTISGNYQFNGSYPTGQWGGCVNTDQVGMEINLNASPPTLAIRVYHAGAWGSFSTAESMSGIAAGPYFLSGDLKAASGNNTTVCTGTGTCGIGPLPSGYSWWK